MRDSPVEVGRLDDVVEGMVLTALLEARGASPGVPLDEHRAYRAVISWAELCKRENAL